MFMWGVLHFLNNITDSQVMRSFLLRQDASGLYEFYELFDKMSDKAQHRWLKVLEAL